MKARIIERHRERLGPAMIARVGLKPTLIATSSESTTMPYRRVETGDTADGMGSTDTAEQAADRHRQGQVSIDGESDRDSRTHQDPDYVNTHLDRIRAVTPDRVVSAARHFLRPESRAVLAYRRAGAAA